MANASMLVMFAKPWPVSNLLSESASLVLTVTWMLEIGSSACLCLVKEAAGLKVLCCVLTTVRSLCLCTSVCLCLTAWWCWCCCSRCSGRVRIVITTLPLMQREVVTSFKVRRAPWRGEGLLRM